MAGDREAALGGPGGGVCVRLDGGGECAERGGVGHHVLGGGGEWQGAWVPFFPLHAPSAARAPSPLLLPSFLPPIFYPSSPGSQIIDNVNYTLSSAKLGVAHEADMKHWGRFSALGDALQASQRGPFFVAPPGYDFGLLRARALSAPLLLLR